MSFKHSRLYYYLIYTELRNTDYMFRPLKCHFQVNIDDIIDNMIYSLTAIGQPPGGSSTVHICTKTINRTTQNKQQIEQHKNQEECGPCPVFAGFTLAFALKLREKHGKTYNNIKYITYIHIKIVTSNKRVQNFGDKIFSKVTILKLGKEIR